MASLVWKVALILLVSVAVLMGFGSMFAVFELSVWALATVSLLAIVVWNYAKSRRETGRTE